MLIIRISIPNLNSDTLFRMLVLLKATFDKFVNQALSFYI